jgi:hypothetical protein
MTSHSHGRLPRAQYQNVYRDGFRNGYEAGCRGGEGTEPNGGFRLPWPF